MATAKITTDGNDGTIKFITNPSSDLVKYYHKNNIIEMLNQPSSLEILGAQKIPVSLDINDKQGEPFQGEAYALAPVLEVDLLGNPTKLLIGEGAILALSCRPFQSEEDEFELSII